MLVMEKISDIWYNSEKLDRNGEQKMVILITGASHTGKTLFAQKLLEKHNFPYLSIDHLKMGLIRSGNTDLTPCSSDSALTAYLWPIVREIIKTAIENKQNLIVEGCYVPFDYYKDFSEEYLRDIKFCCLILSERYIENHFSDIIKYESVIESRIFNDCAKEELIKSNKEMLEFAEKHGAFYQLIDEIYDINYNI